jgi:hypothetical protein
LIPALGTGRRLTAGARLRAHADLVEQAADPHGGEVRAPGRHAGARALEHGVEAGALEGARAPRHAEHGRVA